ncbi:beta-lactamase family protein [Nocardia yamanashiensis]|uniref:serine hydrolase domain-containing protein n=1 Tax=Nocardia yamanashiensis TaxID=209247 RepID=UPI001E33826F|nr:serine hydrolase domain-containing protein [Nocardia yamanashiensis]UGT43786.1 beta-lactamase family protein [Nocardia yamanashiensis]
MRFLPILGILVILTVTGCATVHDSGTPTSVTPPAAVSAKRIQDVQRDIDALVKSGVTGAIATVTENGQTVTLTAGVADRGTGAPIPATPDQQVRVGSISKSFVGAIMLQLVDEGRVRLDEPVDTYLPGLLRGQGVDGRTITVRQILQHRSGLPEFSDAPEIDEYRAALESRTQTPAAEVALALRNPAQFAPGATYKYTNTNYIVAAMIIEKVSGRAYSEELAGRILTPVQLTNTYLPPTGEHDIRGPHPHGYATIDGVRTDVTLSEPSIPWAAGALVSTGADLNRFYLALLAGQIVAQAQLADMLTTESPIPDTDFSYGIGIGTAQLSCGTRFYGHTGGITGFLTNAYATKEGRAVTLALTEAPEEQPDMMSLLGHALCP